MKRVLVLASVASMIDQFNMPNIRLLQDMGYGVDVACNFLHGSTCSAEKVAELKQTLAGMDVGCYQIDFAREITNIAGNLKAIGQVCRLMRENRYAFLHCHSPIGGVAGRIAGKRTKTKVIYTAHGFHFFQGAPRKNWLLYYPVERACARWTDVLITINQEDYALAQKKMKAKRVEIIPGVGVDMDQFAPKDVDRAAVRRELGIPEGAKWLLSVGELNENKNHGVVIRALANMPGVYYTIAGQGALREEYLRMIQELGLSSRVFLLGFRSDVRKLYAAADGFVFPSLREGLSVSLMEAMASGLPCAVSRIRGNTDLIDASGGVFFRPDDIKEVGRALENLCGASPEEIGKMQAYNRQKISQFSVGRVMEKTRRIYASME